MIIQILGNGEKRAVVYPLLHILNNFGGGLLITDDGMYRRVVTDKDGFIGNVRLFISPRTSHAVLKAAGIYTYGYDVVIHDVGTYSGEADAVINVRRACDEDGECEDGEYKLFADFERGDNKQSFIPLTMPLLKELRDIEVSGRLGAFKNPAAVKTLCPVFAEILGVSEGAIRYLLRKGGTLT